MIKNLYKPRLTNRINTILNCKAFERNYTWGTKTNTGPPSFWISCWNLYSFFSIVIRIQIKQLPCQDLKIYYMWYCQRQIFIFGALGYFKLEAFLKGLWRLVHATLTEQVVPIHNHIALFWIPSIPGTKTVIMESTKKPGVKLSDNTPIQGRIQPVSLGGGRFQ